MKAMIATVATLVSLSLMVAGMFSLWAHSWVPFIEWMIGLGFAAILCGVTIGIAEFFFKIFGDDDW